jgi:hypothetical protein
MSVSRETLEDHLERYEQELRELNSYIAELKAMTDKHDTASEHFAEDLLEAEHNVLFYESEIARIKKLLRGPGWRLPQSREAIIGALLISSLSFVAGILIGTQLGGRDR